MKWLGWFFVLVVVACAIDDAVPKSPPSAQDRAAQEYRVLVIRIQRAVKEALRDPSSAKFGPIFIGRKDTYCGTVDAKNGFGGFTGSQVFTVQNGELRIGNTNAAHVWKRHCAGI